MKHKEAAALGLFVAGNNAPQVEITTTKNKGQSTPVETLSSIITILSPGNGIQF